MNRKSIDEVVRAFGLTIAVDRITSGTSKAGFHQFEIIDKVLRWDAGRLREARDALRRAFPDHHKDFIQVLRVYNPENPDAGMPFLEVSSVYIAE